MSSFPPPPPPDRRSDVGPDARGGERTGHEPARRPRYLVVALITALLFGAGCWIEGCGRLAFLRGEHEHGVRLNETIRDDADRASAEALYQRYVDAADGARGRAVPLAAATFVLGVALLALAARGLGGRSNTRSVLMQVVAAQAIVVAASTFATRDMRAAEADWEYTSALYHQRDRMPPEEYARTAPTLRAMRRFLPPGWLALRTLASVLVLVALARPRSRAFFEAAGAGPVSER